LCEDLTNEHLGYNIYFDRENTYKDGEMWHSVISVSGIKVRYNPYSQELRLTCVKRAIIKLSELSAFYVIQVSLSLPKRNSRKKYPPNPPKFQNLSGQKLEPLKKVPDPQPLFKE